MGQRNCGDRNNSVVPLKMLLVSYNVWCNSGGTGLEKGHSRNVGKMEVACLGLTGQRG